MIDTLFTVESGKLYAGTRQGDTFVGTQVRNGRLFGPVRSGLYGKEVAWIVGAPLEHFSRLELPRDRKLDLAGWNGLQTTMGRFLDQQS